MIAPAALLTLAMALSAFAHSPRAPGSRFRDRHFTADSASIRVRDEPQGWDLGSCIAVCGQQFGGDSFWQTIYAGSSSGGSSSGGSGSSSSSASKPEIPASTVVGSTPASTPVPQSSSTPTPTTTSAAPQSSETSGDDSEYEGDEDCEYEDDGSDDFSALPVGEPSVQAESSSARETATSTFASEPSSSASEPMSSASEPASSATETATSYSSDFSTSTTGAVESATPSAAPANNLIAQPDSSSASAISTTSAAASTQSSSPASSELASRALAAHNSVRAKHGAVDLTWSDEVAAYAQTQADKCVFQHSSSQYGENIAAGSGDYSIESAVTDWVAEESQYDPSNPQYSHFTQVVWKGSTQLGCAVATCSNLFEGWGDSQLIFCNYEAAGNVIGQFAENVQV